MLILKCSLLALASAAPLIVLILVRAFTDRSGGLAVLVIGCLALIVLFTALNFFGRMRYLKQRSGQ